MTFNCAACAQPHSPHHKIHFKKGGHQSNLKKKLMPPRLHTAVLLSTTGGALPPFKFNRQDRLFMDIGNATSCCARFYFTTSGLWWFLLYPYSENIELIQIMDQQVFLASQRRAPVSVLNVLLLVYVMAVNVPSWLGNTPHTRDSLLPRSIFCIFRTSHFVVADRGFCLPEIPVVVAQSLYSLAVSDIATIHQILNYFVMHHLISPLNAGWRN